MRKITRLKFHHFSRHHYFTMGMIVGLLIAYFLPQDAWTLFDTECPEVVGGVGKTISDDFEPQLNLINKPMAAKKVIKNIIRPRYYSSELGIRDKLFIGVMTSQKNINVLATAFNKTTAHLVNKIKYFINADNVKSNFKLKNIVGFTDTRENLRPFHVLKYIADNYINDYDYFVLTKDNVYIDARRLIDKLNHISISFDVYIGKSEEVRPEDYSSGSNQRRYCDLNSAIILSSSVIQKIRANLDWCVRNAQSSSHSVNIGDCILQSTKIEGCQNSFQGIEFNDFKLNSNKIYRDLNMLQSDPLFNKATIVHPVTRADDIYTLHTYFSRLNLEELKLKTMSLERNVSNISNGTISNNILERKWPLGVPKSGAPETRHDIVPWTFLNTTHQLMPNHIENVKVLSATDAEDVQKILNRTLTFATAADKHLKFTSVHTIYKRFDPVRGMDYILHLNYFNTKTNQEELRSYEIVKPLGKVEIITSPYVTESTRVSLLLPVFEHQIDDALDFIQRYEKTCMANRDNTFLMLIFLYKPESPNKGSEDIFNTLKKVALNLSDKFKNDGSRIAWVSIRLPDAFNKLKFDSSPMLSSVYGNSEILSIVVTDLALRKIGLDSLVLLCSSSMSIKSDFLNRVRMNTIRGFQLFNPIGFMMYPCNVTNFCKECESCDVSQNSGYFDTANNDIISFYSTDYVEARKSLASSLPIVHSDNDIEEFIVQHPNSTIDNIVDMFIKSNVPIHMLRAIEPNLRLGASLQSHIGRTKGIPVCAFRNTAQSKKCIHIASGKQIGDALVKNENGIKIK